MINYDMMRVEGAIKSVGIMLNPMGFDNIVNVDIDIEYLAKEINIALCVEEPKEIHFYVNGVKFEVSPVYRIQRIFDKMEIKNGKDK